MQNFENDASPVVISTNGQTVFPGRTYFFKTGVGPLNAIVHYASDPNTVRIVDIDNMSATNNITLTSSQGNKFNRFGEVDTTLTVDVNGWDGTLNFDNYQWYVHG